MNPKPPPEKVAKSLVIYLTVTLCAPLAVAIAPPADGAWWILKIIGGVLALFFIGTFISRREFYLNLIGPAYAGFLLVLALYTVALFLKQSAFSLLFYAAAILFYLGLIPAITKHIREQRSKDQHVASSRKEPTPPSSYR